MYHLYTVYFQLEDNFGEKKKEEEEEHVVLGSSLCLEVEVKTNQSSCLENKCLS